jgi:hypothetical protein
MSDKTALWDRLKTTDPKHTSKFQRSGGFKGTAIKPIWSILRMTEEFGPCGVGWGINEPKFEVVHGNDEALVFCTVSIWHGERQNVVFGVGGDKAIGKNRNGAFTDDEAFKKAFTDAVTNAFKFVGVSADVHMGMFDDSKYVSEMKAEFAEPKRQNPHVTRPEDIYDHTEADVLPKPDLEVDQLSKAKANPVFKELQTGLWKCGTIKEMEKWNDQNRDKIISLPDDWYKMLRGVYVEHKQMIIEQDKADDRRMAG